MRARGVCLAVVVFALCGSLPAGAYVGQGRAWPNGVIRYYNAAADQAWAVKQAADAWNASGARIRLVAAPASKADVRIEHFPRISCTINAEATVGYAGQARIWIFRRDETSPYCNSYMAARSLAHEFGHVLGLGHETRGCALMNPVSTLQGPELCPKGQVWQWRCRLLTPDDVAGAIQLYGGRAAATRGPSDCDLYRGIAAPTDLRVYATTSPGQFRVTFRRPASTAVPRFLLRQLTQRELFVAAVGPTCATNARDYRPIRWDVSPGGVQQTYLQLPAGTPCIAVWAVDRFARESDHPARLAVRVATTP